MHQKISCICITENRPDFLARAIQLFHRQDYQEKELLIFYPREDLSTVQIFQNSTEYNFTRLSCTHNLNQGVFFESAKTGEVLTTINNGDEIRIKIPSGPVIKASEGTGISIIKNPEDINTSSDFTCFIKEGNYFSFRNNSGLWLKTEKDGTLVTSNHDDEWELFKLLPLENNLVRLLSFHEFHNKSLKSVKLSEDISWEATPILERGSNITFVELDKKEKMVLGEKRNVATGFAKGEYLCVWDDDDWHNPSRLSTQLEAILQSGKEACTIGSIHLFDSSEQKLYVTPERAEGWEATLMCLRKTIGAYDLLPAKEDTVVLRRYNASGHLTVIPKPYLYVYNIHPGNISSTEHLTTLKNNSIPLIHITLDYMTT